eukprot:4821463-Amphidinium_carterae.1
MFGQVFYGVCCMHKASREHGLANKHKPAHNHHIGVELNHIVVCGWKPSDTGLSNDIAMLIMRHNLRHRCFNAIHPCQHCGPASWQLTHGDVPCQHHARTPSSSHSSITM